jgi:hypothetical protein
MHSEFYQPARLDDRTALLPRPLPPQVVGALAPYTLMLEAARSLLGVAVP